jgi:hypothetical protein
VITDCKEYGVEISSNSDYVSLLNNIIGGCGTASVSDPTLTSVIRDTYGHTSIQSRRDYDAMVFIEGTSVIAVDSNGSVISRGVAGTDDTTVIQAAIDSVTAGTVYISSGTYYFSYIYLHSDIRLVGTKGTVMVTNHSGIRANGVKTTDTSNITVDASEGDRTITVDDVSLFSIGDYILVNSDRVSHYLAQPYGEIVEITNIVGTDITIGEGLCYYYDVLDNPIITRLELVSNISIENLEITEDAPAARRLGVYLLWSRNVVCKNLKVVGPSQICILISSSINISVTNCEICSYYSGTYSYGVSVSNASKNILIDGNHIDGNGTHPLTIGGSYVDGYPTHIIYSNNIIKSASGSAVDSHYGGVVKYINNVFNTALHIGAENVLVQGCSFLNISTDAISPRTDVGMCSQIDIVDCTFKNITGRAIQFWNMINIDVLRVIGCYFEEVDCYSGTLYCIVIRNIGDSGLHPTAHDFDLVQVSNCFFKNCGLISGAISVLRSGTQCIKSVIITNNRFYNVGTGIYVMQSTGYDVSCIVTGNHVETTARADSTNQVGIFVSHVKYADVSDNIIRDSNRFGIMVRYVDGSGKISNNLVEGFQAGSNRTAFTVEGSVNLDVYGNTIQDDNGNLAYAIRELTSAVDCKIHDNHIQMGSVALLSTGNTKTYNNIGAVFVSELRLDIESVLDTFGSPRLLLPCTTRFGTIITDYTRLTNDFTAQATVLNWYWQEGRTYYYDFNGTAHYLYRANDTDFDFGDAATDDAFSVVCCVNPDDVTSRQIIGKWDDNNQREWRLFFDANGYPTFQLYDESADTYIGRQDQTAFTTGSWQVLVATYDGSGINAGCKIYIDGVQLDDADYDNGVYVAMEAVTSNLMVGALKNAAAYSEYYDGKMTWIGVAAKELSPDEVWSLTQRLKGVLGI